MARKNQDFARFFNPHKSPHGFFDHVTGHFMSVKNPKSNRGVVVWASSFRGTYVKAKHNGRKLVPRHRKPLRRAQLWK